MRGISGGRLRRFFDVKSSGESEADDLREESMEAGATPISSCRRGEKVTACGVIRSIVIRPRAGAPTMEAELYDGTGSMTLVWLGRRQIAGINVGRSIVVEGRITCEGDQSTIFNPRYKLRPTGAE